MKRAKNNSKNSSKNSSKKSGKISTTKEPKTVLVTSKAPIYKIPKNKLVRTLKILKKDLEINTNYNCSPIHEVFSTKREQIKNPYIKLLDQARLCLLNRDWYNLGILLTVVRPMEHMDRYNFPIFLKYANICLLHRYKEHLSGEYLQGVLSGDPKNDMKEFLANILTINNDDN